MNSHLKIWEISCFCIDAFYWFFPLTVLAFLLKYFCISMLLKYLTEVQALKACNERRKKWQRELRILHKRAGLCGLAPWPYIWSFGFYGWLNRTICRVLRFLSFCWWFFNKFIWWWIVLNTCVFSELLTSC